MKTLTLITATLITLAAVATKNETKPKIGIINGNEAKAQSIPYQAFIQVVTSISTYKNCGGSLISRRYILTAARCVHGITVFGVTLGTIYIPGSTGGVVDYTIVKIELWGAEITIHKDFHINGNTAINDIAVVKLPITLDLTKAVGVIKLPNRADKDHVGDVGQISGWGRASAGQNNHWKILMQADVRIVENEVCDEIVPNLIDSTLCSVGINGSEACDEDVGGPLVVDDVQIGIISSIVDGCLPEEPMVFTKIASYLDWIENHTDVVIH